MNRSSRYTSSLRNAAILFLLLALPGCAIFESFGSLSNSTGSISDSLGSFSDSSTSSSGDDVAYQEDVHAYTLAHVRAGVTPRDLRLGLSEVALGRGISDWEAIPSSFVAIGSALADAGIDHAGFNQFGAVFVPAGGENRDALAYGFSQAIGTGVGHPAR